MAERVKRTKLEFPRAGKVRPEFQADSDVNVIMARFMRTGVLPEGSQTPVYGDFSTVGELVDVLSKADAARRAYAALPIEVRRLTDHDPAVFLEWALRPENAAVLEKYGLAVGKQAAAVAPPPEGSQEVKP